MEDLPDEILRLIARQVLEKEEGMRLWCKLTSTCTRLWSFQLPAETVYILDDKLNKQGLPWALGRLREACKLNLTLSEMDLEPDVARALTQAAQGLTKLNILELHSYGDADTLQDGQPWVQTLLLGATSLTALSTSADTLCGTPMLQHLPLSHLELDITDITGEHLESYLMDISCCLTLESLKLSGGQIKQGSDLEGLPSMHLQRMPRLKHVRLDDCLWLEELSLPAGCSVFLDVCSLSAICFEAYEWQARFASFESYITILRLNADSIMWPLGIQGFSNLQCLDYFTPKICGQDLADLQHIPHVRIHIQNSEMAAEDAQDQLQLTGGSWQSLVVFFLGRFQLDIRDVDSFVRDTASFTFVSEDTDGAATLLFQEIQNACSRHGKGCHVVTHKGQIQEERFTFVTLSTSREIAENSPLFRSEDQVLKEGPVYDIEGDRALYHWDDFWPRDPCAPVKTEEKLWL